MVIWPHLYYNVNHVIKFCWWCHGQKIWCDKFFFQKNLYFEKNLEYPFLVTLSKFWACLLKKSLKTQEKLEELEIIYLNGIYICISWYSKICWFPVKKCWCQQNPRGVSCDSYSFWNFFRYGITVPSFIIVGYVWQILGRGTFSFLSPPISEQPWKIPSLIGLS